VTKHDRPALTPALPGGMHAASYNHRTGIHIDMLRLSLYVV